MLLHFLRVTAVEEGLARNKPLIFKIKKTIVNNLEAVIRQDHGLLVELVVQPLLVSHGPLSFLFQVLYVLCPPVVMIGESQRIGQVDLKKEPDQES